MRHWTRAVFGIGLMCALGVIWVAAQDVNSLACAPNAEALWTSASDACISGPTGYICNGGAAPQVEPSGPVSNALNPIGALVDLKQVTAIHSPAVIAESSSGGLVWLRSAAPLQFTGLLVGDVSVRSDTPPDFPAWQSMIVQTGGDVPSCGC